jgi:hypothetical protein
MADDDEKARKARAEGIRKQIESLKKPSAAGEQKPPAPETPAEFVHRRMRELDCGTDKPKPK